MFRVALIASLLVATALVPCGRCCCASEIQATQSAASCRQLSCCDDAPARDKQQENHRCPCEKQRPMVIDRLAAAFDKLDVDAFRFETLRDPSLGVVATLCFGSAPFVIHAPAALHGREMLRAYQTMRC